MNFLKGRVLNFNVKDSAGDIFPSDCNVTFNKERVTVFFDGSDPNIEEGSFRLVGSAVLIKTDDGIDADIVILDDSYVAKLIRENIKVTPAICGTASSMDGNSVLECNIDMLYLSVNRNCDETIKPLEVDRG
jgi:hypothetical protein